MTTYIYEKDLRMMKLRVLESPRHRRTLEKISEETGMGKNQLVKIMVGRFDMSMLENLADRYETWERLGESTSGIESMMKTELFTRYVPLVTSEEMQRICEKIDYRSTNIPMEEALDSGMEMLREAVIK